MKWFYRIRKSISKNIVTKIVEIQVENYAECLRKMGMNEVQVRQRLEAVLKPYGFNVDDFFAH